MLQLTFNPGLTLTDFRTTRPRVVKTRKYLAVLQTSLFYFHILRANN